MSRTKKNALLESLRPGGAMASGIKLRSDRLLVSLARPDMVQEVRERYGRFVRDRVDPGAYARDRSAKPFSRDVLEGAADLGLMGFMMPEAVGGEQRDWHHWALVLHELAYMSADTAFPMLLAYCGTVTRLLYETHRPDLIDRYVLPMVKGRCIGGFAWSEGGDPFSLRTTLAKEGDAYVLCGSKSPLTNGLLADVALTFARNVETGNVVGVLVERADQGVHVAPAPGRGLRAGGMAEWRFDQVTLPEERIFVHSDGDAFAQRFFNERRLEMCCWVLGRMRSLFERCVNDLSGGIRFRRLDPQEIDSAIGKMFMGLETSRLLLASVLERVDRGEYDWKWNPPLSVLKHHVIAQASELCGSIQYLAGGYAAIGSGPYERHIRDLESLKPIAGTMATLAVDLGGLVVDEMQQNRTQ